MNLQPRFEEGGYSLEFMRNSVGIEFKTAGASLDAAAFADVAEDGYVKGGTAVFRGPDGLYVPWAADTLETAEGAGLVAHDVRLVEGSNPIAGVIVAGPNTR